MESPTNEHFTVVVGFFACFLTTFVSLALNSFFDVYGIETSAPLGAYIIIILLNITGSKEIVQYLNILHFKFKTWPNLNNIQQSLD